MPQIYVSDDTVSLLQNVLFLLCECGDPSATYDDAIRFIYEIADKNNKMR